MLHTRKNRKRESREKILYFFVSTLAFASMVYLFWAQSIKLNGQYQSDFMVHINRALQNGGTGYSLEGKLVVFLNQITNGSTIGYLFFLHLWLLLHR